MIGNPEEAKNYFYHVAFKNDASAQEMNFFGQVRSIFQKPLNIRTDGDAFDYSRKKVEKKFTEIHFKVRNMKEEAKDSDEESGISD